MQVRDRSSAVMLSEIQRFVEPGTRIIMDGMASYQNLSECGYELVIHDREFTNSEDTQNIEIQKW